MLARPSPKYSLLAIVLVVSSTLVGVAMYAAFHGASPGQVPFGSPGFTTIANVAQSPCPPCSLEPLDLIGEAEHSGGTPPYVDAWLPGNGQPEETGAEIPFNLTESGYFFTVLQSTDRAGATATSVWQQYINFVGVPPATNWVFGKSSTAVGEAPLTVKFAETSTFAWNVPPPTPTAISWYFGDGDQATGQSVTHTFFAPGEYLTVLNASFAAGSVATFDFTVDVLGPTSPVLTFANNTPGGSCSGPATIQMNSQTFGGTPQYTYNWSFGDGSPNSNLPDPTHAYVPDFNPSTDYQAQLTVTDARGVTGTDRFPVAFEAALCPATTTAPHGGLGSQPPLVLNVCFNTFSRRFKGDVAPNAFGSFFSGGSP
jgi:hypothetical protein